MKMAILVNDITGVGGVERVVSNTANKFINELNYEIDIISVFGNKNQEPNFELNNNINLIEIDKYDINSKIKNFLRIYKSLSKLLNEKKYDVILSCSISITLMGWLIKKKNMLSSNIIAWEHSQYENVTKHFKLIRKALYRFIDGVVTLTKNDEQILKKYNKNTICIYNIISNQTGIQTNLSNKKIIAVGRLEREKGFDMLLQAFTIIVSKHKGWILEIWGEGSQRKNLEKIINDNELKDFVKLKGVTQNILIEYSSSSIFVLSSRTESFGMVLLEAMSCGLPCVSFDCESGPREIITHNLDGYLAKPNDVIDLAYYIEQLIKDNKKRIEIGRNSFIKTKKFSSNVILKEWQVFLNQLKS